MSSHTEQRTAKIYQFPARSRTNLGVSRAGIKQSGSAPSLQAPTIVSGAGWYHDAAIQESQRPGKH